mgnify:CR=1 FL=1
MTTAFGEQPWPPTDLRDLYAGGFVDTINIARDFTDVGRHALPILQQHAVEARPGAESYRYVRFGAAALAVTGFEPDNIRLEVFTGANIKPVEGFPTICSEWVSGHYARRGGAKAILAMALAADPAYDVDDNERVGGLIMPCHRCCGWLAADPLVHSNMPMRAASPDGHSVDFIVRDLLRWRGNAGL